MVTLARRARHIPFAPVVAVLFGVVAAILVAAVPQWLFERAVVASGLPTIVAAAAPPLGLVARLLAIALAFAGVALALFALIAPIARMLEGKARARTPWRDAGYDAATAAEFTDQMPPRRPIFAPDELGAPLMSDAAIAHMPLTLADQGGDPGDDAAELATPVDVADLAQVADAPVVAEAPVIADTSIAGLVRRLEVGLARRGSIDHDPDGSGQAMSDNASLALARRWIMSETESTPDDDMTSADPASESATMRRQTGR